jgi:hypothetical protein
VLPDYTGSNVGTIEKCGRICKVLNWPMLREHSIVWKVREKILKTQDRITDLQIGIPIGGEYSLDSHILPVRKSDGEWTVVLIRSLSVPQRTSRPKRFRCTLCGFPAFVSVSATLTHHIMKENTKIKMKKKETNKVIEGGRGD